MEERERKVFLTGEKRRIEKRKEIREGDGTEEMSQNKK